MLQHGKFVARSSVVRSALSRCCSTAEIGGRELDHLRSEGDINLSPRRREYTAKNIQPHPETVLYTANQRTPEQWQQVAILEEDAKHFLHQTLSTPCLNVLKRAEGIYIEDLQGKQYMDFHGNSVHQVGFGNPKVRTAPSPAATCCCPFSN